LCCIKYTKAVLNGNVFVLSSPPKLFVSAEWCDVAVLAARLDGAVCFFAVMVRDGQGQLAPGVHLG